MDRKQLLALTGGFMILWLLIILGLFPLSLPLFLSRTILFIPFLALVFFGFYSLFYLIYKVINLKDRPEEQIKLQAEIERIRRDPRYQALFRPVGSNKTSTIR